MADEIIGGIYKIENVISGKCYVGSAINIMARWGQHTTTLRCQRHVNIKLQQSWNKHGEGNFILTVLEFVQDNAELIGREQYWIDKLNVVEDGYNLSPTAGSPLGVKHSLQAKANMSAAHIGKTASNETRKKMSVAHTGRNHTPESRAKMVIAQAGRKPPQTTIDAVKRANTGKKHTDEHRAKISAALRGRTFSPETRAKISAAQVGKKISDEARAKMSASTKGKKKAPRTQAHCAALSAANTGKNHSLETRVKMSNSRKRVVRELKTSSEQA